MTKRQRCDRRLRPSGDAALWQQWRSAATRSAVDRDIQVFYARLDEQVQQRGPICWISGKCCKFDQFGHLLYVTGLEIAWVLAQVDHKPADLNMQATPSCVFQKSGLCSIHAIRPMGCRIFFCQEGTQAWQQEIYEHMLHELRVMHDRHDIEYRYMEWRQGLTAAQVAFTADQVPAPVVR